MRVSINAFEAEAGVYADSEASFKNAANVLRRLMTAMLTDKTLEDLPSGPRITWPLGAAPLPRSTLGSLEPAPAVHQPACVPVPRP
jgi:hypothetical protein